ncbi:MAG: DUF1987 domain-containing protein [Bacteroidetes bacterium]|nr:DUF1987 domain-containing protein [Bacteroidota bacterium]
MDALRLDSTEFTPKVIFDPAGGKFEISGESRPENSGKFYEPLINWLDQYKNNAKSGSINFEFRFEYFNSSSAKYILDILKHINTINQNGCKVKIKWSFDALDEDMKESGEEFSKLIDVPFEFVSIE